MRLALIVALLTASLHGAVSRVAYTTGTFTDGAGVTTSAIDTTGASLLVVSYTANRELSTTVVSDSKGNTWRSTTVYEAGGIYNTIYYAWDHGGSALSVGSGHTVSVAQTGYHGALTFAAYSGIQTASDPYDQHNGAGNNYAGSLQPGSITPSANGELLVLSVSISGTTVTLASVSNSFSMMTAAANSGAFSNNLSDLVQVTAAAINPTATLSSSWTIVAMIASFKAAPAASPRRKTRVVFQ